MRLQDDEEEHEQQEVDDGVDEHGRQAGLQVHDVDRPLPTWHLQDAARAQQREQRRRDDRRRPVPHRRFPATLLRRHCSVQLASRMCRRGRSGTNGRDQETGTGDREDMLW